MLGTSAAMSDRQPVTRSGVPAGEAAAAVAATPSPEADGAGPAPCEAGAAEGAGLELQAPASKASAKQQATSVRGIGKILRIRSIWCKRTLCDDRPMEQRIARTGIDLAPGVRAMELPDLAGEAPIDVAERFRDLPGLVLLESARPGRNARWTYLTADPGRRRRNAVGRCRSLCRSAAGCSAASRRPRRARPGLPPFLGGLAGFLGYDLGRRFERLPSIAATDQELPALRLALHDWVVAWDRQDGRAWLGGRAVDERIGALDQRLDAVLARLSGPVPAPAASRTGRRARAPVRPLPRGLRGRRRVDPRLDRRGRHLPGEPRPAASSRRSGATRGPSTDACGRATRPFRSLPRPRCRSRSPARRGRSLSASPEPFLSLTRDGRVETNPIKGTRPRGRDRDDDRRLACELLASSRTAPRT